MNYLELVSYRAGLTVYALCESILFSGLPSKAQDSDWRFYFMCSPIYKACPESKCTEFL